MNRHARTVRAATKKTKSGRKGPSAARGRLQGERRKMPPPGKRRTAGRPTGRNQKGNGKQVAHDSSGGDDSPATERRGGIVNAAMNRQGSGANPGPDRHFLTTWELLLRAALRARRAMPVFLPGVKPRPRPPARARRKRPPRKPRDDHAARRTTRRQQAASGKNRQIFFWQHDEFTCFF